MSVKHVKDYYNSVAADYLEMKGDLEDMEAMMKDHQMSPEQVEQMKLIIAPVKQNYETLSYFMYLLNQPNKKSKQPAYKKQNQLLIKQAANQTKDDLLSRNQESLNNLKEFKEEIV